MITFTRNESTVVLTIDTGKGYTITTRYDCNSALFAILLREQMQSEYNRLVEKAGREQYEEGWNDHKKRNKKKDWFPYQLK
jgi:hypothetical protein